MLKCENFFIYKFRLGFIEILLVGYVFNICQTYIEIHSCFLQFFCFFNFTILFFISFYWKKEEKIYRVNAKVNAKINDKIIKNYKDQYNKKI